MSLEQLIGELGEKACENGRREFLRYLETRNMTFDYSRHVANCGPCRLAVEDARFVFGPMPVIGVQPFSQAHH